MSIASCDFFSSFSIRSKREWKKYVLAEEFIRTSIEWYDIRWKMANGMFTDFSFSWFFPLFSAGRICIMKYVKLIDSPENMRTWWNQQKKMWADKIYAQSSRISMANNWYIKEDCEERYETNNRLNKMSSIMKWISCAALCAACECE